MESSCAKGIDNTVMNVLAPLWCRQSRWIQSRGSIVQTSGEDDANITGAYYYYLNPWNKNKITFLEAMSVFIKIIQKSKDADCNPNS